MLRAVLASLFLTILPSYAFSQIGILNANFNPLDDGERGDGTVVQNKVTFVLNLSDGGIVLFGPSTTYNGKSVGRIVKLKKTGEIDTSFSSSHNGVVYYATEINGKILVCGDFSFLANVAIKDIGLIDKNGKLDKSFSTLVESGYVKKCIFTKTGKIIICGNFSKINGVAVNPLVVLDSTGKIDNTFKAIYNVSGTVEYIDTSLNEKVFVAVKSSILRLQKNGKLDSSFGVNGRVDFNGAVYAAKSMSNGSVYVGGAFTKDILGQNNLPKICRLKIDGSIDFSFKTGTGIYNGNVRGIFGYTDSFIDVVGDFQDYQQLRGTTPFHGGLVRIRNNGNPYLPFHNKFNHGALPGSEIYVASYDLDRNIHIGGNLDIKYILIDSNGNNLYYPMSPYGSNMEVEKVICTNDSSLLFGGRGDTKYSRPSYYNRNPNYGVVKISHTGEIKQDFIFPKWYSTGLQDFAVDSKNRIIVAGLFQENADSGYIQMFRVLSDGKRDPSFKSSIVNGVVNKMAVQSNNKLIVIGGNLSYNNPYGGKLYYRLLENGDLDLSFKNTALISGKYNVLKTDKGDNIYVGGERIYYDSLHGGLKCLVKLKPNGMPDTGFHINSYYDAFVNDIIFQKDGKIIVMGRFNADQSKPLSKLIRINSNGEIDSTFRPPVFLSDYYPRAGCYNESTKEYTISLISGITGSFLIRLDSSGRLDTAFSSKVAVNDLIQDVELAYNGATIITGRFTNIDGKSKNRIGTILEHKLEINSLKQSEYCLKDSAILSYSSLGFNKNLDFDIYIRHRNSKLLLKYEGSKNLDSGSIKFKLDDTMPSGDYDIYIYDYYFNIKSNVITINYREKLTKTGSIVSDSLYCPFDTVRLKLMSNNAKLKYRWTLPIGWVKPSNLTADSINCMAATSGMVSVVVKDLCNDSFELSKFIGVRDTLLANYEIDGSRILCGKDSVFTYSVPFDNLVKNYNWSSDSGILLDGKYSSLAKFRLKTSGNINLILQGYCNEIEYKDIKYIVPKMDTSCKLLFNKLILRAIVDSSELVNCISGRILAKGVTNQYILDSTGVYKIRFYNSGCSDSSHCFVFQKQNSVYEFSHDLVIYPNPVDEVLYMSNLPQNLKSLRILDMNGKILYESSKSFITEIDLSEFIQGIYNIEILTVESIRSATFIIQR